MSTLAPTPLTELQRAKERGHFDLETIYGILDATPLCHIGYNIDHQAIVMPTIHWRIGDAVYWHGSRLSRTMLESDNAEVCLTVTHLDGLVLARSAFHHSANYRSVMVFGKPEAIDDVAQKQSALEQMIEKLTPGRWQTLRTMTTKELNATTVLRLPIDQASAKVRTGGPNDLAQDLDHPVWAGVVPLSVATGTPEPCQHNKPGIEVPDHVTNYSIS